MSEPGTAQNPFLYEGSQAKVERFFLLCAFVAGKHAGVQQRKLDEFLASIRKAGDERPFINLLRLWNVDRIVISSGPQATRESETGRIGQALRQAKVGQYTRLTWLLYQIAFKTSIGTNWLRYAERDDLIQLPGFGLKSASMFLLYTRHNMRLAALDTHVLQWLAKQPGASHVPKSTPSGKLYLELEQQFCEHADRLGMKPADLDWKIWSENSVTMKFLTQM